MSAVVDVDAVAAQKWALGHDNDASPELGSTATVRHELAVAGFLENPHAGVIGQCRRRRDARGATASELPAERPALSRARRRPRTRG